MGSAEIFIIILTWSLKGQCHEIFCFRFFSWITFPQAPENNIRVNSNSIQHIKTSGKSAAGINDNGTHPNADVRRRLQQITEEDGKLITCSADWNPFVCMYTDKKENQIFLMYKEIQSGAVAKSYMTNGLLMGIRNIWAFPHILGSSSSYMTLQLLHSEFPSIWGKFDFLFYQCRALL